MNLKQITIAAVALMSTALFAQYAPVKATVKHVPVYQPQLYSVAQGAIISNQFNNYKIIMKLSKPTDKKPSELKISLDAGTFGFGALVNFMQIKANGIPMSKLMVKAEDMKPWQEGNNAGAVITLNFDGSIFDLIFYMRPDSPVLWCSIKPSKDTIEEPESISIQHSCLPSHLAMNGKKVIWVGEPYNRQLLTNKRAIGMHPKRKSVLLGKDETSLTFRDLTFDGSAKDKGYGPVWMALDHSAVLEAKANICSNWTAWIELKLNPAFKEHKFAFWQQRPRISNDDFAKKLKAEKSAFKR
ncbi:MAG: hypothetical protein IJW23_14040 [Lentisphaeria bacterium]|nr:hypothetical protein [Lentisphaeria bacterium]